MCTFFHPSVPIHKDCAGFVLCDVWRRINMKNCLSQYLQRNSCVGLNPIDGQKPRISKKSQHDVEQGKFSGMDQNGIHGKTTRIHYIDLEPSQISRWIYPSVYSDCLYKIYANLPIRAHASFRSRIGNDRSGARKKTAESRLNIAWGKE